MDGNSMRRYAVSIIALLSLPMFLNGCSWTSGLESSDIKHEITIVEEKLQNACRADSQSTMTDEEDVVCLAGFPECVRNVDGTDYTVFFLGSPTYSAGYQSYDKGYYNKEAELKIEKGKIRFALDGKMPVMKHRKWLFWKRTCLYNFRAAVTPSCVRINGDELPVLRVSNQPSLVEWSSLLPPDLPDHIADLRESAVFIGLKTYGLGYPNAPIPRGLKVQFDREATRKLYSKMLKGEFANSHSWNNRDLQRILNWLDAFPLKAEASALYRGKLTPSFIAFERENIAQLKRNEKARDLLEGARRKDPEWQELENHLRELENAPSGNAHRDNFPMGQRLRFGSGCKMLFYGNAYADPYDADYPLAVNISIFGLYQLHQSISVSLGIEPFKILAEDRLYKNPYDRQITFDQLMLYINYQIPLRVQLGNRGSRLQISLGILRLSDEIENFGQTYKGTGLAFDVGLSLVPRKNLHFHGPESRFINRSGIIEIGYRSGAIDNYTAEGSGAGTMLTNAYGRPVDFRPQGFWLAFNLDFIGL